MPQKGTWKVDKQSLYNNRSKESMKMSRSEIWGHLSKTHTLPMATHSQEASQSYDLFPELWGFQPYRSFTVEMSPLKYMVLNTPRKTMELQGTENLLVKCLCTDWLDPKTSTKTANWKAHGLGERDPLIKVSTVEAGTSWNTPKGLSHWQGPFVWLQATLQSWACQEPLQTLHLIC